MEPHMDNADRAQIIIDQHRDNALARTRAHNPKTQGQTNCADCSDTIPKARRLAHPSAIRCIDCQQHYERRQRG